MRQRVTWDLAVMALPLLCCRVMTLGLCVRRGAGAAMVFALLTGTASAQLLSNLLQPVVTTTTSARCSAP